MTHAHASDGSRWVVQTISAAVSNGHARPNGLNGSCRLSAPAATVTPASLQSPNGGDAPRHRLLAIAALQEQVRRRQGNDRDACGRNLLGDPSLLGLGAAAEADAVTRGDRVLEPGAGHRLGEMGETVDRGVERLVGV